MAKRLGASASILPARRPARAACVVAFGAALLTAGCAAEEILPNDYSDLPESPDVETAPWPRLVDNPASLEEADARSRIARGEEINADLEARAAALQTQAALLLAAPGATDDLSARAAETREAGRALAADE